MACVSTTSLATQMAQHFHDELLHVSRDGLGGVRRDARAFTIRKEHITRPTHSRLGKHVMAARRQQHIFRWLGSRRMPDTDGCTPAYRSQDLRAKIRTSFTRHAGRLKLSE